ncbi:putative chitinase [Pseudomonas sp. 2835]
MGEATRDRASRNRVRLNRKGYTVRELGRDTYQACSEALFGDSRLLNTPELLEQPVYAAMSAGWYWQRAGLNSLADKGDFLAITKKINGGTNGLADREELYERALKVLQ